MSRNGEFMGILSKTIKVVLGSTIAIWIALFFKLEFAAAAGIIALLTIQNTKLETIRLARQRFFSFVVAMASAWVIGLIGNWIVDIWLLEMITEIKVAEFGFYMLIVGGISYIRRWDGSVSTNAVFGTHIFIFGRTLTRGFLLNEFWILVIGTSVAILLNMKMEDKEREVMNSLKYVEKEFKAVFMELSEHLCSRKELQITRSRLLTLMKELDGYVEIAIQNRDNTLKDHSEFYINYFVMRKNQAVILMHMCKSFMFVANINYQALHFSGFLKNMAETFHVRNDASNRMVALGELMQKFRELPLPQSKEELEMQAVLFHELKELEEFLKLKKIFYDGLSEEQKKLYLEL